MLIQNVARAKLRIKKISHPSAVYILASFSQIYSQPRTFSYYPKDQHAQKKAPKHITIYRHRQ